MATPPSSGSCRTDTTPVASSSPLDCCRSTAATTARGPASTAMRSAAGVGGGAGFAVPATLGSVESRRAAVVSEFDQVFKWLLRITPKAYLKKIGLCQFVVNREWFLFTVLLTLTFNSCISSQFLFFLPFHHFSFLFLAFLHILASHT